MQNTLIITTAYLIATLIIWRSEKRRKNNLNYTLIPVASLWLASNFAYIGIPAIAKSTHQLSPFQSKPLINLSLDRQSATIATATILFAIGIYFYTRIITLAITKEKQSPALERIQNARTQLTNSARMYANELGFIAITTSIAGIAFEAHTRFSSYMQNGTISRLISSSMIREVSANAFVFAAIALLTSNQKTLDLKIKKRQITTAILMLLIFCIDIKTGSRSLLMAHLGTAFCGIVVFNNFKPNEIVKISVIGITMLALAIPAGETLRIARSKSSFFKDNPIEVARTIASSAITSFNARSIIENNRRNEFSDAAFLDRTTCEDIYNRRTRAKNSAKTQEIEELKRCLDHAETKIKLEGLAPRHFTQEARSTSKSVANNRQARNLALLGIAPDAISKGETLNLYADLYQRDGLAAVGIWFFMMGISIKTIERVITSATYQIPSTYGFMLAATPLFLLSGSASYTVEFFIFGFPKLIFKLIAISITTGGLAIVLKKAAHKLQPDP